MSERGLSVNSSALSQSNASVVDQLAKPVNFKLIERKILTICREVLQRETISPDTDFFELGGDSLLLLQIIMRISEELGVDLVIEHIDDAITVTTMTESTFAALRNATRLESSDL